MSKIVEATAVSAGDGSGGKSDLAQRIEAAMTEAIKKCQAAGITDPEEIRQAMTNARIAVRNATLEPL